MKLSLKDLFWCTTLASCGMAGVYLVHKYIPTNRHEPLPAFAVLMAILAFTPGPLLGAAVGILFHRTKTFARAGFLFWLVQLLGFLQPGK